MGVTVCPRHGRQPLEFAAPAFAGAIEAGETGLEPDWLRVVLHGRELVCPVNKQFVEEHGLEQNGEGRLATVDDEDVAWRVLEAMSLVCQACLDEFRIRGA